MKGDFILLLPDQIQGAGRRGVAQDGDSGKMLTQGRFKGLQAVRAFDLVGVPVGVLEKSDGRIFGRDPFDEQQLARQAG